MIKTARTDEGLTPSVLSGRPSECLKDGEPMTLKEAAEAPDLTLPKVPVEPSATSK